GNGDACVRLVATEQARANGGFQVATELVVLAADALQGGLDRLGHALARALADVAAGPRAAAEAGRGGQLADQRLLLLAGPVRAPAVARGLGSFRRGGQLLGSAPVGRARRAVDCRPEV